MFGLNRVFVFMGAMVLLLGTVSNADPERPNIVWISTEDIGPHIGCYGDPTSITPTLDTLAERGVRFSATHTVTPVCATNRSSMMAGMYASTLGSQHMRSGGKGNSNTLFPDLPKGVKPFTMYLRDAGYFCSNSVKEDFNFAKPEGVWDTLGAKAHWRGREDKEQPFFSVFNFTATHESYAHISGKDHEARVAQLTAEERQDPDKISPPPYHPNTPEVRLWWARYLENITLMDHFIADRLKELEEDGLSENTIVVYWSDHGAGMPRNKRWLHDSGTLIPHVIYAPEKWQGKLNITPGTVDDRLITSIDFAPNTLQMAGLEIPGHMQGQAFTMKGAPEARTYIHGIRDRMDERLDMIRSVRDERYKYIRYYMPYKPFEQNLGYAERHGIKREIRRLIAEGDTSQATEFWRLKAKPLEQLFDCEADPHNMVNLAADPKHKETLERFRAEHQQWMMENKDTSLIPEPELHRLGLKYGSRNAVWDALEKENPGLYNETLELIQRIGQPAVNDVDYLISKAKSMHAHVRYWSTVGLGLLKERNKDVNEQFKSALKDECPEVRIAAAQALGALDVLKDALESDEELVRIVAAQAIDELDEKAEALVPALEAARADKNNKYVSRIANQALNELQGTNIVVR